MGYPRQMFSKHCLSSSHLCSSVKFCQPAKIIDFDRPNVGLVDGQRNEKLGKDACRKSKYVDSGIQFCQLGGNLQRKEIEEDRMNRTFHSLDQLDLVLWPK